MSDRTPRLSDEYPGHFEALADHPLHDPGRPLEPDRDSSSPRDLDEDPSRRGEGSRNIERDGAAEGLSDDLALYGDAVIGDQDHHLSADLIDGMHGGPEPDASTATARIGEDLELYGGKPLAGEHDSRDVWVNLGEPLTLDEELPAHVQAAFDQALDGILSYLDAAAPQGFQMADERESLLWGIVNTQHHQHTLKDQQVKQLTVQIETLRKTQAERIKELGRDGASLELEEKTHQLLSAAEKRDIFERLRDRMADLYFQEAHKVWAPRKGSHISRSETIASQIDSKEFQKARRNAVSQPDIPEGTVIAVTGTRIGTGHDRIIETLDAYLKRHPDMVLLHGNAQGTQRTCSKWAKMRDVPEVALAPDFNKYDDKLTAIKKRDAQILAAAPDYMLSFTGPGERLPFMHRQAMERGIAAEHIVGEEAHQARKPTVRERALADSFLASAQQERPAPATHRTRDAAALDRALTASFDAVPAAHDLSLRDVHQGTADLYHKDRKIGLIERVSQPGEGYPLNAHLLQLDRDPGHVYVIPAGKDPATQTRAIVNQPALTTVTHLSPSSEDNQARLAEPREQALANSFLQSEHGAVDPETATRALETFVDAALPPETALSEEAAHYDTQDRHPLRTALMSRVIGAVDSLINGPGGADQQLADHAREARELERADIQSDIDIAQQRENHDKLAYAADALDRLENFRNGLAETFYQDTGEHWSPPLPQDQSRARPITAASTEAINLVERLEQERYQSRLPTGRPIAVTALNTDADRDTVFAVLDKALAKHPGSWLAHGNAPGVLHDVSEWAKSNNVEQVHFLPDWQKHPDGAIKQRDLEILALDPIGVIEFNDGERPSMLARQMRQQNPNRVLTIPSSQSKAAQRQREESQQRSATERQSQDQAQEMSAGMSW